MSKKYNFSTTDLLHAIRQIPLSLISALEKHILVTLLSCLNAENKTWYSLTSMCEFSCLSIATMKRYILKLEQKSFIKVERPAHYARRITNQYCLNIDYIMSFHLTKSGVTLIPDKNIGCHADTRSHTSGITQIPVSGITLIPKERQGKKDIKKERERSLFFEPNEANILLAMELKLDMPEELASFANRHKGEKTQYEYERWLKGSFAHKKGRANAGTEVRSMIPEYAPGHPTYDMLHGVKKQVILKSPLQPVEPIVGESFAERKRRYIEKHGGLPHEQISGNGNRGGNS